MVSVLDRNSWDDGASDEAVTNFNQIASRLEALINQRDLSDGVETIEDRAILGGLSGLVGSAVNGFRFYGQALSSQVDTRVADVLQGTKDAAGYVQQGHNQIAVEVEQKMVQAESDGDFSMFLPPET